MAAQALRPRVLVVEDDPLLREFYRITLKNAGFRVVAVEDGLDALEWIEQQAPDAIVLDLSLMRLSGRDLLRDVRARPDTRHISVVVVTGADDLSDLEKTDLACVLQKPVTPMALVDAVTTA